MDKQNRIEYFLGIDGGGTKTEFLLTDTDANEINRVVLGASNPVNSGIDVTKAVLKQGIELVCKGVASDKISAFAGIAGGMSKGIKEEINGILSGFGFGICSNGSDVDSALELALHGENGVAVIAGTGVVGFAKCGDMCHRIGGWGYMVDKGGSGFNYGSYALECAFKYFDGRGGSKLILDLIEQKLEKPLNESVADIYSGGAAYVASFAPIIFEAYKMGDSYAEDIIEHNTEELAQIIRTGCSFFNYENKSAVICGGLCNHRNIIWKFLKEQLGNEYAVTFNDEPVINGAISLAKRGAENAQN